MYYNKQKYVSDTILINDTEHNKDKKYKNDKLNYQCYTYKSNDEYENELFNIKEESLHQENPILEYRIECSIKYEEEKQEIKNYGDIDFFDWLSKQRDPKVAIFAELVNAPKLNNNIEKMRDKINTIDTISIKEYSKIKKLGSRSVKIIKELKQKYGPLILKFLYLSIS